MTDRHAFGRSRRPGLRCPRCGKGKLFRGFLTLRPRCEVCGLDYCFADAGDGPAVFIILFAGFIVVGAALITEVIYQPPYLGACGAVAAVDPDRHARAAAADEGPADRAAVSSQGRGRPARRRRAMSAPTAAKPAQRRRRGWACCIPALIARGPGRARHLAARAQGLEGRADRDARPAARRAAGRAAGAERHGRASIRRSDEYRRVHFHAPNSCPQGSAGLYRRLGLPARRVGPGLLGVRAGAACRRQLVVVDRGFVPAAAGSGDARGRPDRRGPIDIIGVMRWPEAPALVHAGRRSGAQCLVRARSDGDRGRQEAGARSRRSTSSRKRRCRPAVAAARAARGQPARQPSAIRGDLVRPGARFWPWFSSSGRSNPAASRAATTPRNRRTELRLPCETGRFSISVALVRDGMAGRLPKRTSWKINNLHRPRVRRRAQEAVVCVTSRPGARPPRSALPK